MAIVLGLGAPVQKSQLSDYLVPLQITGLPQGAPGWSLGMSVTDTNMDGVNDPSDFTRANTGGTAFCDMQIADTDPNSDGSSYITVHIDAQTLNWNDSNNVAHTFTIADEDLTFSVLP